MLSIARSEFNHFLKTYEVNKKPGQRLGQAFYDYFGLGKIAPDQVIYNVFGKDGDVAINYINEITTFT